MNAAPVTPGGRLVGLVGVVLIVVGLAKMWSVAQAGVDFPSMYVMGTGIASGTNIYDPSVAATFPERTWLALHRVSRHPALDVHVSRARKKSCDRPNCRSWARASL